MSKRREVIKDALDTDAVKLLKTDPAKFFESTRRQPFGFVAPERTAKHADPK